MWHSRVGKYRTIARIIQGSVWALWFRGKESPQSRKTTRQFTRLQFVSTGLAGEERDTYIKPHNAVSILDRILLSCPIGLLLRPLASMIFLQISHIDFQLGIPLHVSRSGECF